MSVHKLLVASLILAATGVYAGSKTLPIRLVQQEHSQWCWSASSVAVLGLYGQNPSQCSIVNWAFGRSDACGDPNFDSYTAANQPNGIYGQNGSIQSILQRWGLSSSGYANALSWSSTVANLNANRPFVLRFGWTAGGGHFVVGYAYSDVGGKTLSYMNPWPGEGLTRANYNWVVNASDHRWTHTLTMNR